MFHSARIKLTVWYLLIIMIISSGFSFGIRNLLTAELDRFEQLQRIRFERRMRDFPLFDSRDAPMPLPINTELIEDTKNRIDIILIGINAGVFIFAGGLGYFLAGRTLRPISEMVDEQNRFISDASHELKTPLTSLKTGFEVFLKNPEFSHGETKIIINESLEEVNKLQKLTESLLELAQNNHHKNKPSTNEDLSLKSLIQEAIHNISKIADNKNIKISDLTTEVIFKGNKLDYLNCINAVLDNAVKYTTSIIELSNKVIENRIELNIKDDGIGISKSDQEKIFERFYRADKARTKKDTGGYGLGLSIAKKTIEKYGGSIEVESEENNGSIFAITFPASRT